MSVRFHAGQGTHTDVHVDVDLVGNEKARDILAVFAQLLVPVGQILVRHLARDIENLCS